MEEKPHLGHVALGGGGDGITEDTVHKKVRSTHTINGTHDMTKCKNRRAGPTSLSNCFFAKSEVILVGFLSEKQ